MSLNNISNLPDSDIISIRNLELYCYHGVLPEEKEKGQNFIVSLDLYTDVSQAAGGDDLNKTINYAEVCDDVNNVMTSAKYDLIETAAEKVAELLLIKYNKLNAVTVLVKKPEAPIDFPFEYVSVKITRKWHTSYLSVGSNIGDKEANINYALEKLRSNPAYREIKKSENIITEPYGPVKQDTFLNACIQIQTIYQPLQLLNELKKIENEAGRTPTERWGPRILDLDIIFYDDAVIREENLIIPHEDMHNRLFVLAPLSEIAPNIMHPIYKKSVKELLDSLTD